MVGAYQPQHPSRSPYMKRDALKPKRRVRMEAAEAVVAKAAKAAKKAEKPVKAVA